MACWDFTGEDASMASTGKDSLGTVFRFRFIQVVPCHFVLAGSANREDLAMPSRFAKSHFRRPSLSVIWDWLRKAPPSRPVVTSAVPTIPCESSRSSPASRSPHYSPRVPYTQGNQLRLLKALFSSNSLYAVLMITELFGIDCRINQPGTSGGENWRFRLPWTLGEIRDDSQLMANCDKLATILSITRRA